MHRLIIILLIAQVALTKKHYNRNHAQDDDMEYSVKGLKAEELSKEVNYLLSVITRNKSRNHYNNAHNFNNDDAYIADSTDYAVDRVPRRFLKWFKELFVKNTLKPEVIYKIGNGISTKHITTTVLFPDTTTEMSTTVYKKIEDIKTESDTKIEDNSVKNTTELVYIAINDTQKELIYVLKSLHAVLDKLNQNLNFVKNPSYKLGESDRYSENIRGRYKRELNSNADSNDFSEYVHPLFEEEYNNTTTAAFNNNETVSVNVTDTNVLLAPFTVNVNTTINADETIKTQAIEATTENILTDDEVPKELNNDTEISNGRRFYDNTETNSEVKNKLLTYLDVTFEDIVNKLIPINAIKRKYIDDDVFKIGFVVANIETLQANIIKLKEDVELHKHVWDDRKILETFDKLMISNKVIANLLEIISDFLKKNSEIEELSKLAPLFYTNQNNEIYDKSK